MSYSNQDKNEIKDKNFTNLNHKYENFDMLNDENDSFFNIDIN